LFAKGVALFYLLAYGLAISQSNCLNSGGLALMYLKESLEARRLSPFFWITLGQLDYVFGT